MARIFISYSRADALFIEQLVPLLEQVFPDYEIWYDKHLTGGDDWWKRILDEISACDLFIYLLSNESLASDYCQAEFREGLRLQKLALPVIVRPKTNVELAPDDLKAEIKRRNWIDMSGGFKDASANGSLYRAVRLQVAKIPVQPHPPLHPDPVAQPIVIKPPSKGLDPTVVAAIIGAIALVIAAMVGITPTLVGQLRGLANPDTATFTPSSVSTTALAMVPTNPTVSATPSMTLSFTSVPASATPHLTDTQKPTLTLLPASATNKPMPMVLVTATAPDTPVSVEDSASTLDAQDAQKTVAAQTLTATLFTQTPTATRTPTIDTSSTVNAIRTQRVMGTHAAQQTLIATRWTRTPTPSFTPTYTATPTITPTPTFTSIPPTATNVPPTLTPTLTPIPLTATKKAAAPLEICYGPAQIAKLRVIHASPNSPAVDVYLDKATTPAISNLAYGSATDYVDLAEGTHQVKVTVADDAKTVVLFDRPVKIGGQTAYSLVAEGTIAEKNITVDAYVDDLSDTAGKARVVVIHAVPDAGPVDVITTSDNKAVISKLAFGKSASLTLDPQSYDLAVTAAGDATKVLIPLAATKLEADKIYTIIAIGLAGSNKVDKAASAITAAVFISKSVAGFEAPLIPTPVATTAATKVATFAATKTVVPPTATLAEKDQKSATAGLTPVNTNPKKAARHLSDGSSCIQVGAVAAGGPAAAGGIKATDYIIGVDGVPVKDAAAFLAALDKHASGDKVVFDVQHAGTLVIVKETVTLGLNSFVNQ